MATWEISAAEIRVRAARVMTGGKLFFPGFISSFTLFVVLLVCFFESEQ